MAEADGNRTDGTSRVVNCRHGKTPAGARRRRPTRQSVSRAGSLGLMFRLGALGSRLAMGASRLHPGIKPARWFMAVRDQDLVPSAGIGSATHGHEDLSSCVSADTRSCKPLPTHSEGCPGSDLCWRLESRRGPRSSRVAQLRQRGYPQALCVSSSSVHSR